MNDNELITVVKESVTDVHMNVPAEQITRRGRALRARRQIPALAAADKQIADQTAIVDAQKAKLADLEALRRELKGLIEQCGHGTIGECRIIEALSPVKQAKA